MVFKLCTSRSHCSKPLHPGSLSNGKKLKARYPEQSNKLLRGKGFVLGRSPAEVRGAGLEGLVLPASPNNLNLTMGQGKVNPADSEASSPA